MSCVQTGYFMSSYKLAPSAHFGKLPDGGFEMKFPTAPDKAVLHLDVNADTGPFVYAVSKMPPGNDYMAEGSTCSWTEYLCIWSEITGVKAAYRQVGLEEFIENEGDREFGREAGDMFDYSSEPGYDGGDSGLLKAEDLRKVCFPFARNLDEYCRDVKAGIECHMTSLEEFMKKEDWSTVLSR